MESGLGAFRDCPGFVSGVLKEVGESVHTD